MATIQQHIFPPKPKGKIVTPLSPKRDRDKVAGHEPPAVAEEVKVEATPNERKPKAPRNRLLGG